jgi:hypothetical protein
LLRRNCCTDCHSTQTWRPTFIQLSLDPYAIGRWLVQTESSTAICHSFTPRTSQVQNRLPVPWRWTLTSRLALFGWPWPTPATNHTPSRRQTQPQK